MTLELPPDLGHALRRYVDDLGLGGQEAFLVDLYRRRALERAKGHSC